MAPYFATPLEDFPTSPSLQLLFQFSLIISFRSSWRVVLLTNFKHSVYVRRRLSLLQLIAAPREIPLGEASPRRRLKTFVFTVTSLILLFLTARSLSSREEMPTCL